MGNHQPVCAHYLPNAQLSVQTRACVEVEDDDGGDDADDADEVGASDYQNFHCQRLQKMTYADDGLLDRLQPVCAQ